MLEPEPALQGVTRSSGPARPAERNVPVQKLSGQHVPGSLPICSRELPTAAPGVRQGALIHLVTVSRVQVQHRAITGVHLQTGLILSQGSSSSSRSSYSSPTRSNSSYSRPSSSSRSSSSYSRPSSSSRSSSSYSRPSSSSRSSSSYSRPSSSSRSSSSYSRSSSPSRSSSSYSSGSRSSSSSSRSSGGGGSRSSSSSRR